MRLAPGILVSALLVLLFASILGGLVLAALGGIVHLFERQRNEPE